MKKGKAFRVEHQEYKKFELYLTKKHYTKAGNICNALLVKKLDLLLNIQGNPTLGFNQYDGIPEQSWLYKIARMIDTVDIFDARQISLSSS